MRQGVGGPASGATKQTGSGDQLVAQGVDALQNEKRSALETGTTGMGFGGELNRPGFSGESIA